MRFIRAFDYSDEAIHRHGVVPVNHMVVVTEAPAREQPEAVAEFCRLLEASKQAAGLPASNQIDTTPFGRDVNLPCLERLIFLTRFSRA